jgi:hypothetical protein
VENSTDKPKNIDEQLAEANRQFDARLAADKPKAAVEVKPGVRVIQKTEGPRKAKPKRSRHAVGEVAHPNKPHYRETDTEIIEMDCYYVEHVVRDRKGFTINDTRYRGKVIVPQCVANTLAEMENKHQNMERGVFEDRGRQLNYGELRG